MSSNLTTQKRWMRINSHSSLRFWMVWVLCFCAWRGPLPLVHCHTSQALSDVSEPNWQLAGHLAACHASEPEHQHDLGWHLHFVMPSNSPLKVPNPSPLDDSLLAKVITHDLKGDADSAPAPVTNSSIRPNVEFAAPFLQPSLVPTAPKLIPLAPPRTRPARVSPRIYYCVVQC